MLISGLGAWPAVSISADAGHRKPGDTVVVRPTALIVDDHPSFRRMASRLLAAAGYDVVGEAADAAGALTAARQCRPAVILLDVLLPDGSGIDVADVIGGPGASVVLLVSSRAAADFGPALDGRDFVTKSELTVERLRGLASDD
jgi:DNA-binding NarL/FixJ family response regulator